MSVVGRRWKALTAGCCCMVSCLMVSLASAEPENVRISGAVLQPGQYEWRPGARLLDASVAGAVGPEAWPLGAALLRASAIEPQQRLKAGALFELSANRVHAKARNDEALHQLVDRLYTEIEQMPVTGRVTAELDPLQLLLPVNNPLLEPGDQLIYPLRPDSVNVVGAVEANCRLAFGAALQPRDYLEQCPRHRSSDPSYVYLIQPNGLVSKLGIGAWNLEPADIAVGAVLYVPISTARISPNTTGMNEDMAAFYATQYRLGGRFSE